MKKSLALILSILTVTLLLSSCGNLSELKDKLQSIEQNITKTDDPSSAHVAKFGITLSADGSNVNSITSENNQIIFDASPRPMAPGTSGSQRCITYVNGTSEVSAEITTSADVTISGYEIDGSYYCPITCTINGQSKKGNEFDSASDFEAWIEKQISRVTVQCAPGSEIDDIILEISWVWAFDSNDDVKDSQLGELAAIQNLLNIQVIISQSVNQIS